MRITLPAEEDQRALVDWDPNELLLLGTPREYPPWWPEHLKNQRADLYRAGTWGWVGGDGETFYFLRIAR